MDKRKWLWKRRSSERSSGETESSGSLSSPSERYSDEQQSLKDSPNDNAQSQEVTSKASVTDDEVKDSFNLLKEKLSAALLNVSAKEDLVKQHAKVAEEAVAGWEKAEKEVTALKQKNEALEVQASHLDGALKECVRQLRRAKEEQEQRIRDTVLAKEKEWASVKAGLENKILELQSHAVAGKLESPAPFDHNVRLKLEFLEKENNSLKAELASLSKELEIRTFERELSTQAAETASKQHLESIKKVTKLESECRRLQASARKSSYVNDEKSISSSSFYVESLTDSLSDSGEKVNTVEMDIRKMSKSGQYDFEPSCSGSWASALIAELDQFRNEKTVSRNLVSRPVEIDMMDDFLDMERLAASPETEKIAYAESCTVHDTDTNAENPMKVQLETMTSRVAELEEKLKKVEAEKADLETVTSHIAELEEKLVKIEAEKNELEGALSESKVSLEASQAQLGEAEISLEALQKELALLNESKELLEFKLIGAEVDSRTMAASIDSLKAKIEREQTSSAEMAAKCRELENELKRKSQEVEFRQPASFNNEQKIKKEELSVAADRLAECQKTIASLGKQLESLATLEDFLIDTANLPGFSGGGALVSKPSGQTRELRSSETFITASSSDPSKTPEIDCHSSNMNDSESPPSSSSSSSCTNQTSSSKSRNGFGKLFSRSKIGVQLDNHQE